MQILNTRKIHPNFRRVGMPPEKGIKNISIKNVV
jgi:hypothetical protein